MRRITLTIVTTVAILVLLFSYHTSRDQSVTAAVVSVAPAHVVSQSSSEVSTAAPTTTTSSATTKVDGAAASTRYGDVQVEVTITGGKITDVEAIEYPDRDPRDQQINSDALPQLQAQVLAAQSANIAGVSGATFTTEGYLTSLQSALDAANFK